MRQDDITAGSTGLNLMFQALRDKNLALQNIGNAISKFGNDTRELTRDAMQVADNHKNFKQNQYAMAYQKQQDDKLFDYQKEQNDKMYKLKAQQVQSAVNLQNAQAFNANEAGKLARYQNQMLAAIAQAGDPFTGNPNIDKRILANAKELAGLNGNKFKNN